MNNLVNRSIVFEMDHQKMNMFEFVRCSKNDVRVRSMFDKMVFATDCNIFIIEVDL